MVIYSQDKSRRGLACSNGSECSKTLIKPATRLHVALLKRSKRYHDWHHHPKHKIVHWATLAVYLMIVTSVVVSQTMPSVTSASNSSWNQTNWNGGTGGSTSNQYSSASNIDASSSGKLRLTSTEKLSNPGFETTNSFSATGGTVTTSGDYTIHTFTSGSGTFTSNGAGNVEVLVVAGGGGGTPGTDCCVGGGGGGAGGVIDES